MKVLLINGSPHKEGCTYTALKEVADTLEANGIKTEMMYLGVKPIAGCIACGNCQKSGKCFVDDRVNELWLCRYLKEFHRFLHFLYENEQMGHLLLQVVRLN